MTCGRSPSQRESPECRVPVLVEHDGRSVALSADGRRAGSEREIPINHRRTDGRTGAGEQKSERARSHSLSPPLIHALISPARERERDIPDIPPHWGVQISPPRSLLIRLTGALGSHARFLLFNYLLLSPSVLHAPS